MSFIDEHAESTGKVGAVGFCFGGGDGQSAWLRRAPSSTPASPITAGRSRRRRCPTSGRRCMLHYAEKDDGVNAGIEAYEAALKANNKKYVKHVYAGTQHSFNNDLGAAATTRRPPISPGSAPSSSSANTSALRRARRELVAARRRSHDVQLSPCGEGVDRSASHGRRVARRLPLLSLKRRASRAPARRAGHADKQRAIRNSAARPATARRCRDCWPAGRARCASPTPSARR